MPDFVIAPSILSAGSSHCDEREGREPALDCGTKQERSNAVARRRFSVTNEITRRAQLT